MDPRIALVGLVVGLFVGISGVGGSSLVTPLMILVMGVQPLVAVGTDLAYSVPTKLLGAIVHARQGTVNRRVVLFLSLGGLPAAVLGIVILATLKAHLPLATINTLLQRGLGAILFFVAVLVILTPLLARWRARPEKPAPSDTPDTSSPALPATQAELDWTPGTTPRLIVLGAIVGFLVSLTSIGSGSLTLPVLYLLVPKLGLRRLVGADVVFAALLVPIAFLGHLKLGTVNFTLSANLVIGSLPGVFIGSKLCRRLPDFWFRPAIAGILLFAGSRLI